MGAIVKITCASCKSTWQCRKGCGIQHGQFENVKILFPLDIQYELENYEAKIRFPFFDFGFQLSICEHCKSVESIPVIQLPENQEVFTGVCQGCGQKTELIGSLEKTRCPVCGEYSLSEEDMGVWD